MSEKIKVLYYALWVAHPLLESAIAALMFRRGLHRKFKFFFAYIFVQLITFAVLFSSYWHSYSAVVLPLLDLRCGSALRLVSP